MKHIKKIFALLFVALTASAVVLYKVAAVSVFWPLETMPEEMPLTASKDGPVSGEMTLRLMQATDTKRSVVIDGATGATVVRFHSADENGEKSNWPMDETNENVHRYIDFSMTAPDTTDIQITRISMLLGAYATTHMKCFVNVGFGAAFTNAQTLYDASQQALTNMQMDEFEWTPQLTVPAGDTLHLRVLPWHEDSIGADKYILVRSVLIYGTACSPQKEGYETVVAPQGSSRKVLKDGQLFLYRDGKQFTIRGQEIR